MWPSPSLPAMRQPFSIVIQGRDKILHIFYTYNRRLIKYVHVTLRP